MAELKVKERGVIAMLETKTSKHDLQAALRVIREFKSNESRAEWVGIMFAEWSKLEQLEEFLGFLVDGKDLAADTEHYAKMIGVKMERKQ